MYEALGRARREEFKDAVRIMDAFIGRPDVFRPRVIIVDAKGNRAETTNRTKLPEFEHSKKSVLLGYLEHSGGMPLTNPADIREELDVAFRLSKFAL